RSRMQTTGGLSHGLADEIESATGRTAKAPDVEELIGQRRDLARHQELLRDQSRQLFVESLEARRKFERIAKTRFEKFMPALSAVAGVVRACERRGRGDVFRLVSDARQNENAKPVNSWSVILGPGRLQ